MARPLVDACPFTASIADGADDADRELIAALERYVPQVMSLNRTPGLNLAVWRHGDVIWTAGFGHADVASGAEMTPATIARAGSMSKLYTATAVMQLVERGAFTLDDEVNALLDGWDIHNPLGDRAITVRDLMTHRAGMSGNAAACSFTRPPPLRQHLVDTYARARNDFYHGSVMDFWTAKVGESFQYSNTGIATLGYLVEVHNPDGLTFAQYLRRNIFDRLDMTSSAFEHSQLADDLPAGLFERISTGYSRLGDLHVPTPIVQLGDGPAGNLVTTPADHVRFLSVFLRDGAPLLTKASVEQMLSTQVEGAYPGADLGLVFSMRTDELGQERFGHSGAYMWGWMNISLAWPKLDLALTVCVNQWNLLEGAHAPRYAEGTMIAEFIVSLLTDQAGGLAKAARPDVPWAWKVSYAAGLLMAERVKGQLSIDGPLTDEMVQHMAQAYTTRPAEHARVWDLDGFRAGIDDMLSTDLTVQGIYGLLASDRLRVSRAELTGLFREIGGIPGAMGLGVPG